VPEAGAGAAAALWVGLGVAVCPEDVRELLFFGGAALAVPLDDALPEVVGGAAATRCTPVRAGFAGVRPAAHEAPSATALVTPTMTDVVFLTS
jgi:hypothetical protein